jgi:sulfatase maturation enzyme AslB (radical SAM superfamily)
VIVEPRHVALVVRADDDRAGEPWRRQLTELGVHAGPAQVLGQVMPPDLGEEGDLAAVVRAGDQNVDHRSTLTGIDTVAENKRGILEDCTNRDLVVQHLPTYYHVHLNEPCNQKCIMCMPNGSSGKDELSFEDFLAFFGQIKPYAEHITLIGGEPLMYSSINEVLDLLAAHPIEVSMNTNATMLIDRTATKLLALHKLNLKCSVDATTSSTYLRIRGKDHFERVTSHLRRFADQARDLPDIRIIPVFVVMRENLSEVVPFVHFAKSLGSYRVEFHPVRHISTWLVSNGTGWTFDGKDQQCEAFSDEFNDVMAEAAAVAEQEGLACEVHYL